MCPAKAWPTSKRPPRTHRIVALDGVCGAHFGVASPDTTRVKTRESELCAKTGEDIFDAVVMVNASGRPEMTAALPAVIMALKEALSLNVEHSAIYDLAYLLTVEDVA